MTITLYRLTDPGDNLGNVPADEKVIFSQAKNPKDPTPFISDYDIVTTTGIGNNQTAEQPLGDHQDLGPIENMYTLRGLISQRDKESESVGGLNPFLEIFKKFDEENKTNDSFKHGRIGIDITDMSSYSLIPVGSPSNNQVGLIWKGMYLKQNYEANPLVSYFEIQLIVDVGDDQ